ncbi:MAG: ArsA-related P-loop ATPase [Bacteriovoracaceae bacterium]
MSSPKRFYIITGKGGVGKTAAALALTKRLNSQGKKARYLNYTTSSLSSSKSDRQEILFAKKMDIPHVALNLLECSQGYVGKKMKSQMIAKWVVKTPFFKALMSMLPGFNYLIYLGKTLELLKEDPELIFILDSPSSGHALTMLEATKNFGEIFQSGLLFEDTQKMIKLLYSENFLQINILTLPTLMAVNEAIELKKSLAEIAPSETHIFCNNSFKSMEGVDKLELPPFLRSKLETERLIEEQFGGQIKAFIKHSLSNQDAQIINDLTPSMDNLA